MAKEITSAKEGGINPLNAVRTEKPRTSKLVVRDKDGNWVNVKITYRQGDLGEKLHRLRDMGYDISNVKLK